MTAVRLRSSSRVSAIGEGERRGGFARCLAMSRGGISRRTVLLGRRSGSIGHGGVQRGRRGASGGGEDGAVGDGEERLFEGGGSRLQARQFEVPCSPAQASSSDERACSAQVLRSRPAAPGLDPHSGRARAAAGRRRGTVNRMVAGWVAAISPPACRRAPTSPARRIAIRSASSSASSRWWVVRTTAAPRLDQVPEIRPDRAPALRVQPGRRLVQNHHTWAAEQRQRHVEPPSLTAGQATAPGRPPCVPEIDLLQRLRRPGAGRTACPPRYARSPGR